MAVHVAATNRLVGSTGKSPIRMGAKLTLVAVLITAVVALLVVLTRSPRDETIISEFKKNKEVYERLIANMQIDDSLSELAPWGFRTFDSLLIHHPPAAGLSVSRYNEYMKLLNHIEASEISRTAGAHPDVCVYVWGSGWGADTRHVAICSLNTKPSNTVAVGAIAPTGGRRTVHIEGLWYLERDG